MPIGKDMTISVGTSTLQTMIRSVSALAAHEPSHFAGM